MSDKINVIKEFEKSGKSQILLAEQFGVGKTQIQQTIKRKAEYMTAYEENTHSSRKRLCTRLNSDDLETIVWTWFKAWLYVQNKFYLYNVYPMCHNIICIICISYIKINVCTINGRYDTL